jgi:hypothetical protein
MVSQRILRLRSGQAATLRAARPDSLGKLGTGSSLRKERLFGMTIKLHFIFLNRNLRRIALKPGAAQ